MKAARVFVVDDNVVARSMLTRILSDFEEIEVVGESGTGHGVVIMLEEVYPDVVMLETAIGGGMNVSDIIKEIKQISPDVKVVLCTDSFSPQLVIPAMDMGADDFIAKPYKKNEIIRSIRKCMGW